MAKLNLNFIARLIETILQSISPDLKDAIKEFLDKLEAKAKETKNPFDDVLVVLLRIIFD